MFIQKQYIAIDQYFQQVFRKTNIVLHHTVSSSAQSARSWWQHTPSRIGTAFIIEKDGTIIQCFDDAHWAHHLGLRSPLNLPLNRASIGIELVNEGYLWPQPDGTFNWLRPDGPEYDGDTLTMANAWRGASTWPIYPMAQVDACAELITMLCKKHSIPRTFAPQGILDMNAPQRYGIYAHHNVRLDKTDVSPALNYDLLT